MLRFILLSAAALLVTTAIQSQVESDAFEDCNCPEGTVGQRCRFDQFLDSIHVLEAAIRSYDESFAAQNYAEVSTIGSKVLEQYDCEALRDSITSLNVQLTNAMGCSDSESCNYNPASTSTLNCAYPTTWYYDGDGDGLGRDSSEVACTASLNFVDNNSDLCDDTLAYNYNDPGNLACILPPDPEALSTSGMAGETATINGSLTNPSGLEILEVGFYFNTDTLMPAGTNQTLPATLVEGGLQFDLSSLVIGTKYFYQVYAVTSYGTVVSAPHSFTASTGPCEGLTTATDYDGNTYNLVEIGDQCWFHQNLKNTHFNDGTALTYWSLNPTVGWGTPPSTYNYRIHNDDPEQYLDILGYAYEYQVLNAIATTSKDLCPSGFNTPTTEAWIALNTHADAISESTSAIQELASSTYWNGVAPGAGMDLTGIGVRDSGYLDNAATITPTEDQVRSWYGTSTKTSYLIMWAAESNGSEGAFHWGSTGLWENGFAAIRCIKSSTDAGLVD